MAPHSCRDGVVLQAWLPARPAQPGFGPAFAVRRSLTKAATGLREGLGGPVGAATRPLGPGPGRRLCWCWARAGTTSLQHAAPSAPSPGSLAASKNMGHPALPQNWNEKQARLTDGKCLGSKLKGRRSPAELFTPLASGLLGHVLAEGPAWPGPPPSGWATHSWGAAGGRYPWPEATSTRRAAWVGASRAGFRGAVRRSWGRRSSDGRGQQAHCPG